MIKTVCAFLLGMISGMIITMFITFTILDNRMDNIEPSFTELQQELELFTLDAKKLQKVVQTCYNQAGVMSVLIQDVIYIGREEVNAYNELIVKLNGDDEPN